MPLLGPAEFTTCLRVIFDRAAAACASMTAETRKTRPADIKRFEEGGILSFTLGSCKARLDRSRQLARACAWLLDRLLSVQSIVLIPALVWVSALCRSHNLGTIALPHQALLSSNKGGWTLNQSGPWRESLVATDGIVVSSTREE